MKILTVVLGALFSMSAWGQGQPLRYYLPAQATYNPTIPTPEQILGHDIGAWHLTHDRLVYYMQALAMASDRITLEKTGETHEGRPLLLLTITSPENHPNIEKIREDHLKLTRPGESAALDISRMPAVFYVGYSIHGNEASGANASVLMAYHLAAAQGAEMESYLKNTIVLLDPCLNPDGMQRFSSWVNARKSKHPAADPYDTEHNEAWPGGRFNHYWFDLNRDWLVAQHPESQARARSFHRWKPNVLTDHHEMGTNATFFFQPGVPSRVHPLTPAKNLELTRKIGTYHAQALNEIGSLYYTQEGFDDFYYGKGSTFPDVQGAIGILFEQASSRGHLQESINGPLSFAFTIRNQFVTSLSSLRAVNEMRVELLTYQRDFFRNNMAEAAKDPVKGYLFGSQDRARLFHFVEMILRHDIAVTTVPSATRVNGKPVAEAFAISLNQPQYRLIKSMFEKRTQFTDSLFYDISSWTLPLAFGLEYEELKAVPSGTPVTKVDFPKGNMRGTGSYAWVISGSGYYFPRAVYRLLNEGIRVKISTEPFVAEGKKYERGTLLIASGIQSKTVEALQQLLQKIATEDGLEIQAVSGGLDYEGVSLGSSTFIPLRKPEIAMVVDAGISATDAGEIWHLLDTRYNIPVTLLPIPVLNTVPLQRYNAIIIPEGSYGGITEATREKLRAWVQAGGLLIGFENALPWFTTAGLGRFEMKKQEEPKELRARPYADIEKARGALATSGAIFQAQADLTHPLLYGYDQATLPLFKANNLFMEKAKGAYANPLVFGTTPLVGGYIQKSNYERLKNSSFAGVSIVGRGRVIGFTDNLAFRGFWLGTNRMLMNALFYGSFINSEAGR